MVFEGEMTIDDKRYEDIIRIGFESARKNIKDFESRFNCSLDELPKKEKEQLAREEIEQWRICLMVVDTLQDKVN